MNKITKKELSEKALMELLDTVVSYNEQQMEEAGGDQNSAENLIEFVDENSGQVIYNPYYDSTCRFSVNPFEEYGKDKIIEMINKFFNQR